jgi:hypothetical protein
LIFYFEPAVELVQIFTYKIKCPGRGDLIGWGPPPFYFP